MFRSTRTRRCPLQRNSMCYRSFRHKYSPVSCEFHANESAYRKPDISKQKCTLNTHALTVWYKQCCKTPVFLRGVLTWWLWGLYRRWLPGIKASTIHRDDDEPCRLTLATPYSWGLWGLFWVCKAINIEYRPLVPCLSLSPVCESESVSSWTSEEPHGMCARFSTWDPAPLQNATNSCLFCHVRNTVTSSPFRRDFVTGVDHKVIKALRASEVSGLGNQICGPEVTLCRPIGDCWSIEEGFIVAPMEVFALGLKWEKEVAREGGRFKGKTIQAIY